MEFRRKFKFLASPTQVWESSDRRCPGDDRNWRESAVRLTMVKI